MKNNRITRTLWKGALLLAAAALALMVAAAAVPLQAAGAGGIPAGGNHAGGNFAGGNHAAELLKPAARTITVEALIDGHSRLILQGNTARWLHFEFAAPGRHEWVDEPTVINGKEWYPTWPDQPDAENRFCECYSSVYKGIKPALPNAALTVELKVLEGRGEVSVVDPPAGSKRGAVVVEFDDNPQGGPAVYKIELTIRHGGK